MIPQIYVNLALAGDTSSRSPPPRAFRIRCVAALPSCQTNFADRLPGFFVPSIFFSSLSTSNEFPDRAVNHPEGRSLPLRLSRHLQTRPTTSSFVNFSHSPSVPITTKASFISSGRNVVVVTTGSAVTYGGVL